MSNRQATDKIAMTVSVHHGATSFSSGAPVLARHADCVRTIVGGRCPPYPPGSIPAPGSASMTPEPPPMIPLYAVVLAAVPAMGSVFGVALGAPAWTALVPTGIGLLLALVLTGVHLRAQHRRWVEMVEERGPAEKALPAQPATPPATDGPDTGERLRALGPLARGIAHEIRNPLSTIIGLSQLCAEMLPPDSPVLRYLTLIEREGKRTHEILESLLELSPRGRVPTEPIDPRLIVEQTVALCKPALERAGVRVHTVGCASEIPPVQAHGVLLRQALMNLLFNAQHSMAPGGEIRLRLAMEDGAVLFEVADQGAGIPAETLPHLFEPGFTTRGEAGGTGLGLSLSREIVERFGGTITVTSAPGQGSVFTIRLPAAPPSLV